MLRLYGHTGVLALRRAVKAWPVAFSLVLYAAIGLVASFLVQPLGMIGGFLIGFLMAACLASYLHLLSQAVAGGKLTRADLTQGFKLRFWDVVSVLFAFWILSFVLTSFEQAPGANGPAMGAVAGLAMAFFFNAAPELLYLGHSRSFGLLVESGRFVMANPVAWMLPNLLFAVILLAPTGSLAVGRPAELLLVFSGLFSPTGVARTISLVPPLIAVPLLLVLHYAMVFRGLLFQELTSGSSRLRDFHRRSAG